MSTAAVVPTSKLKNRQIVAENTTAFFFEKPAGFEFKAGQSLDLTLINPVRTDEKGNTRPFSIASAPGDADLMIATRMRDSAFKNVLAGAPFGLDVKIDGPFGDFTLHKNAGKPALFFAGGIGITPFFSIAADAARNRLPHQIYLFYSNRRPEDSPFLDALQRLAAENANFHLIATMTDMAKSSRPWSGETGFIDDEMVRKHVADPSSGISYLAGPPAMVAAMRQMLVAAGADEDNIRTEEFSGY
jgi:ferredoxin-NADP reductase